MFNTLNDSLESYIDSDLVALWPLGTNVNYSQTVQVIVEDPCRLKPNQLRLISVYRDDNGMYEAPCTYFTN